MPVVEPISNFETNVRRKGKAGRPALAGERYPSGKLKAGEKRDTGPSPAVVKRTFERALRGGADAMVGTSLGLLLMTGKVTAPEFAAGQALGRLWGRYDRAMGMPGRFTLSPDYGTARAISDKGEMSDAAVAAVRDRFRNTMALLGVGWADTPAGFGDVTLASTAGKAMRLSGEAARSAHLGDCWRTVVLLERVCVDDLACEGYELPRLVAALDLLVPWFGIEPRKP